MAVVPTPGRIISRIGPTELTIILAGIGWASNPDIKVYDYNPQKAREKLIEAGYPDGVTFDYWCSATATGNTSPQLCEMLQAMLAEVGINTDIIVYLECPGSRQFSSNIVGQTSFRL